MTPRRFLPWTAPVAAAAAAATMHLAYRKDIRAARRRIAAAGQVVVTPEGPVEFAESGDGPAVLVIHGAGGGFDQGLDLGRAFVGGGHRVIAPSRFGYLGTPLPAGAMPEAQADAHLRLLDALELERVPVIGVSAGAPSALQLCLRHPERCSALALIVPLAYAPQLTDVPPSRFFEAVLNAIAASDFLFWAATKVARPALLKTILGTPPELYRDGSEEDRRNVDAMLRSLLPMSRRVAGIWNDSVVSSTLTRPPLENLAVPLLVISAADDGYGTYERGLYTAEAVPDGRFVGFRSGGHLLLGHDDEVREAVAALLQDAARMQPRKSA